MGRRSTAQALARREPERRLPILLTLVSQSAVDVLDEVVQLFEQAVSARESHAKHKLAERLAERAVQSQDRLALLDAMLPILLDPAIADEEVGGLLRGLGLEWLRAVFAGAQPRLPRDHGQLSMLDDSFAYLRKFVPQVLEAITFRGGEAARDLITAVGVLRELHTKGARNSPRALRSRSCRPAGAAISTRPGRRATRRPTGTSGSCVSCTGCGTGCGPGMSSCPAHAATPIPPPTSSPPGSGSCAGPSSANRSASPPTVGARSRLPPMSLSHHHGVPVAQMAQQLVKLGAAGLRPAGPVQINIGRRDSGAGHGIDLMVRILVHRRGPAIAQQHGVDNTVTCGFGDVDSRRQFSTYWQAGFRDF